MVQLVQRTRGPEGFSPDQAHLGWPSDVTVTQRAKWLVQYLGRNTAVEKKQNKKFLVTVISQTEVNADSEEEAVLNAIKGIRAKPIETAYVTNWGTPTGVLHGTPVHMRAVLGLARGRALNQFIRQTGGLEMEAVAASLGMSVDSFHEQFNSSAGAEKIQTYFADLTFNVKANEN